MHQTFVLVIVVVRGSASKACWRSFRLAVFVTRSQATLIGEARVA